MKFRPVIVNRAPAAFTLIEIALCLAIIGIALVAIIGVLPIGMHTQRDTREETTINQDATVLLEAIRNGVHGMDDLTNYVYAITNTWTLFNSNGTAKNSGQNVYRYDGVSIASQIYPLAPFPSAPITNGANIIGLLSMPLYVANTPGFPAISSLFNASGYSNHIVAMVRSLSGNAAEKPPQTNPIMVEDSFTYKLLVLNAPEMSDTNIYSLSLGQQAYSRQLAENQRELRMTFYWPVQPNGKLGTGRQTFRATIAGQLTPQLYNGINLYFYQPNSFTNAP